MLAVHPHEYQTHDLYLGYRIKTPHAVPPMLDLINMTAAHHHPQLQRPGQQASSSEVTQALEVARESPDGAKDPTISNILETALSQVWGRVQAQPDTYIMSRDEFAVFNFFQHRFVGDRLAVAARQRYWDNTSVIA